LFGTHPMHFPKKQKSHGVTWQKQTLLK